MIPPSVSTASPRPGRSAWWIAPVVVVGLVVVAFLVLAGLPFGRDKESPKTATTSTTETIAEGTAQSQSTTLVEVPPGASDDSFDVGTPANTAPPPANTATMPPPVIVEGTGTPSPAPRTPAPAPRPQTSTPRPQTSLPPPQQPKPQTQQPKPQTADRTPVPPPVRVVPRSERQEELSGGEAVAVLRSYVDSNNYYRTRSDCLRIENRGYRNVGYDLEVWSTCAQDAPSVRLGRWRVDSKTRELFRQRDDGRYLKP